MQRRPWAQALFAVAIVAVFALVVTLFEMERREEIAAATSRPPATFTTEPEPDPTVVLVVGDSYTSGSPMNAGSPTWVEILARRNGWILFNDSQGATGYASKKATDRNKEMFLPRVRKDIRRYEPDLVILAGGLNDWAKDQGVVAAKVREVIDVVRRGFPSSDVVMFSPFGGPDPREELLAEAANFRRIAEREGLPFFDVSRLLTGDKARLVGTDGLHPVPDGHKYLAGRVGVFLDGLGLPKRTAFKPGPGVSE